MSTRNRHGKEKVPADRSRRRHLSRIVPPACPKWAKAVDTELEPDDEESSPPRGGGSCPPTVRRSPRRGVPAVIRPSRMCPLAGQTRKDRCSRVPNGYNGLSSP